MANAVPVIRTQHLGLRFGGAVIVDDVSLDVHEGEFLTIIGPNGAGKTSLFNLLSGLYRASAGTIEFGGRDITHDPPFRRTQVGLGRTFQVSSVFPALTVLENVRLAVQARRGGNFQLWRRARGEQEAMQEARAALARVGLAEQEAVIAGSLPHGAKRKLELAILLGARPRAVLLDEPTAGLSAEDVPEFMQVIRAIHREEGKTVMMVEHRMDVIVGLSDRMAVMHHGALLAVDTPERVMENEKVQTAYLGEPL